MTGALNPIIKVTIGDGRDKQGEISNKNPNLFYGRDAPKKAIAFLKAKFPGEY